MLFVEVVWVILKVGPGPIFEAVNISVELLFTFNVVVVPNTIKFELTVKLPLIVLSPWYISKTVDIILLALISMLFPAVNLFVNEL